MWEQHAWSWREGIRGSVECVHTGWRKATGRKDTAGETRHPHPPLHPRRSHTNTCTYLLHGRVVPSSLGFDLCRLQTHDVLVLGMVLLVLGRREQGRPEEGGQKEAACSA